MFTVPILLLEETVTHKIHVTKCRTMVDEMVKVKNYQHIYLCVRNRTGRLKINYLSDTS